MYKSTIFTLSSLFALIAFGKNTPAPELVADIKPALSKDNIDEEEMRLAKMIHERILEKKKKSNSKQAFSPYEEAVDAENKIAMVPIKAGNFTWQGEQANDKLEVTLSAFWMGSKEITWDQYDSFSDPEMTRARNGYFPDHLAAPSAEIDFLARPTPQYYPIHDGLPQDDGYPMLSVTQHAANKYCQWLSYKTGHFYRLPTEAEWEYACRADSKAKYSWGDDPAEGNKYAWFGGAEKSDYHKPGLKKPNAWGLYDMHGNMMEWTLDQYVPNRQAHFAKDAVTNPWVKATEAYPHVAKGGHWKHDIAQLAANQRYPSHPKWKVKDPQEPKSIWYHTSAQTVGFRIVRPEKVPTAEEMYHYWNSGVELDGLHAVYPKWHELYKPEK